ncbi:putative high osmolarity signaling protein Sho1 [Ascobolus immersus RN42]|uniref:Putative high osmolarity signaling protein Sho1 n=1 Tax=Ascobolus immersus RN42 TaxID=1160509 RepID=A0A3N4HKK5_ASCIM|nr:putative high osmolarity signaling protein Sho1 [Ascobolus immersus RN42]
MHGRGRPYGKPRFDFGNVIGDPFALATISIAFLAWVISIVGTIIGQNEAQNIRQHVPKFVWWTISYFFCDIMGVAMAVTFNTVDKYAMAIVAFQATGLVFATSAVNSMVYDKRASLEAAAAGMILLSMICIVWILKYGQNSNPPSQYGDPYSYSIDPKHGRPISMGYHPRPDTSISHNAHHTYSSQLAGFEIPTAANGGPLGPSASGTSNSQSLSSPQPLQQAGVSDSEVGAPTEYPYRAKAIYNYTANPDDANEISFAKHEILEVSDVSGRWWQARKSNGETGIAPSNYLILL